MPYLAQKRHTTVSPSQVTRESKTHQFGGFFILKEIQARLGFPKKYKTASDGLRDFVLGPWGRWVRRPAGVNPGQDAGQEHCVLTLSIIQSPHAD